MQMGKRRAMSALLAVSLLVGGFGYAFAKDSTRSSAADPYRSMTEVADRRIDESLSETVKKTDRYLVKYKSGAAARTVRQKLEGRIQQEEQQQVSQMQSTQAELELIILNDPIAPKALAEELKALHIEDSIEYIQPDFILTSSEIRMEVQEDTEQEDPVTEEEENAEAPPENDAAEAEENDRSEADENNMSEGKEDAPQTREDAAADPVLVALIDSGVDLSHEWISDFTWTSAQGTHGWNFVQNSSELFQTAQPWRDAHGTRVAGIIAQLAREHDVPLEFMVCKTFEGGRAYTSDVIAAITFARENGARLINMSFGGGSYNPALYETMRDTDALFITASGNQRANLDVLPVYPACFDLPNIIRVASVNADSGFSFFSNYSAERVDIAARGRDVISAAPGNQSGACTGTSMAAAYVSGVCAAVWAQNAEMTAAQVKNRVLTSADRFAHLQDKVCGGRRVNLQHALQGTVVQDITQVTPAEDFDPTGYHLTDGQQLELFGSKQAVAGAVGGSHYLILMEDGTVWSFGRNIFGQLGTGEGVNAYHDANHPVQVLGLSNIIQIAAGATYSLALAADGTLWEWGQLMTSSGIGEWEFSSVPVTVQSIANVTKIAVGDDSAMAIANGRQLYAWGSDGSGKISGCYGAQPQVMNADFERADQIAVGYTMSGVLDYYRLYAMGSNSAGQLCKGNTTSYSGYQQIPIDSLGDFAMGGAHTIARGGSTLYAWGKNTNGQLGVSNNYTNATTAQTLTGLGVTQMALGAEHSLFIRNINGTPTLYGCGDNSEKQLAGLSDEKTDAITQISLPVAGTLQAIAAGFKNSLAIYDGRVWVWGSNVPKHIDSSTSDPVCVPVCVGNVNEMEDEDSAFDLAWPWYYQGELQEGTSHDQLKISLTEAGIYRITCTPWSGRVTASITASTGGEVQSVQVSGGTIIAQLTSGVYQIQLEGMTSCQYELRMEKDEYFDGVQQIAQSENGALALDAEGHVWAWGALYTSLQGATHEFASPVYVPGLSNVIQIVRAGQTNYALRAGGDIYIWGEVTQFQENTQQQVFYPRPVRMMQAPGAKYIAACEGALLAVKMDGTVWGLGNNANQRICADFERRYVNAWTQVAGISDVEQVALGYDACAALKTDGTVWSWGADHVALGRSAGSGAAIPAQVSPLSDIVQIRAGIHHMLALRENGTVSAWGSGAYGQFGDGTSGMESWLPIQAMIVSNVTDIDAGKYHSVARQSDGKLFAWGRSNLGQCETEEESVPIPQRIISWQTGERIFAGAETTFALCGEVYGMGSNGGSVLGTWGESSAQATLLPAAYKNDTSARARTLSLRGGSNFAVGATLPEGAASYYTLSTGTSARIMLRGQGMTYKIYDVAGVLLQSGSCSGAQPITLESNSDYTLELTTAQRAIFGIAPLQNAEESSVSLSPSASGATYRIIVEGENLSGFGTYSVTYDADALELISACAIGDGSASTENLAALGIQILEQAPGVLRFKRTREIPEGARWSGAINMICVRAKKAGDTTLYLLTGAQS